MKRLLGTSQVIVLMMVAAIGFGCAKKESISAPSGSSGTDITTTPPPATTTNQPPNTTVTTGPLANASVATTPFAYDSLSVFNEYVASNPVNNPSGLAINVDMSDIGGGRFAGTLKISYYDNGQWRTGTFQTGTGTNQISYHDIDVGKSEAEFNRWFTWNNKQAFHAFFQDQWGAVILVIDDGVNLGDGGGTTIVSGSVWFKNFALTPYGQYGEKCWFVRAGPYDCRTWVQGDWTSGVISTTSALYPNSNGYKKLGTFTSLNRPAAFHQ